MKKLLIIIIVLLFAGAAAVLVLKINKRDAASPAPTQTVNVIPMKIQSSAFSDNQPIPKNYSCDGDGINPPLEFSDIPQQAQTLALTVTDPDAPNGLWVHWLVWNIPTTTTSIAENSVPVASVVGQGSSGQNAYQGPCPPSGTHHYIFTLYALDAKLDIPAYSTLDDLTKAMQGHILQQAQLVGLYSKN